MPREKSELERFVDRALAGDSPDSYVPGEYNVDGSGMVWGRAPQQSEPEASEQAADPVDAEDEQPVEDQSELGQFVAGAVAAGGWGARPKLVRLEDLEGDGGERDPEAAGIRTGADVVAFAFEHPAEIEALGHTVESYLLWAATAHRGEYEQAALEAGWDPSARPSAGDLPPVLRASIEAAGVPGARVIRETLHAPLRRFRRSPGR